MATQAGVSPQTLNSYRDTILECLWREGGEEDWDAAAAARAALTYLPEIVTLAHAIGPRDLPGFERAIERTVCLQCGGQNPIGICYEREFDLCSFYHYLPVMYDAIHHADRLRILPPR